MPSDALRRCAALRAALALARAEGRDQDVLVFRERLDVLQTALRAEISIEAGDHERA